jgi:hypothetical protein
MTELTHLAEKLAEVRGLAQPPGPPPRRSPQP